MLMVFMLGALGTGVGILAGVAVQGGLAWMMTPFLPERLDLTLSWTGVAEALLLGFAVVTLFSFLPLYRLREMRPMVIFNRLPTVGTARWPYYLSWG
jgi:putative ABC transport system permease protein